MTSDSLQTTNSGSKEVTSDLCKFTSLSQGYFLLFGGAEKV